jgi:hypothetical protein
MMNVLIKQKIILKKYLKKELIMKKIYFVINILQIILNF